jgi:hypothetical protein
MLLTDINDVKIVRFVVLSSTKKNAAVFWS